MPEPSATDVSFIIPAFNEEHHVGDTVRAIHEAMRRGHSYDIVVVDHGSSDRTATVAAEAGAKVLPAGDATSIAELRNRAARRARGRILVFIDADVVVDRAWGEGLVELWRELEQEPRTIAGAPLDVPPGSGWIASTWFRHARADGDVSQVGSGHMIVPRSLFESLGGFPALVTGEDHALCVVARARGARIITRRRLVAYHLGAPQTLRAFLKREMWHGRGDVHSAHALLRSPVVWAAAAFVLLHAVALAGLVGLVGAVVVWTAVIALIGLVTMSSVRRTRSRQVVVWGRGALLFYAYYWARALTAGRALAGFLLGRKQVSERRTRAAE